MRAGLGQRVASAAAVVVVALLPACQVLEAAPGSDAVAVRSAAPADPAAATPAAPTAPPSTPPPAQPAAPTTPTSPATPPRPGPPTDAPTAQPTPAAPAAPLPPGVARPDWLGTRPLPLGPDGEALPQPTPDELVVRRIPTLDLLPPPPPDAPFAAAVRELSDADVARSTWTPACPVDRTDLRLLTMSFWGFDDRPHTGEMIVHADWAAEVVDIFRQLFDARYPIEEMRIVSADELEGTPTGDGNVTSGFVCRPVRGATTWSQHALGLAVDVNPFHNPYRRGERILPELAGAYLDREHERPGMLHEGSVAVRAFDAIGWGWGGRWTSLIDWMHFSASGR